jgi:hypothetical protein
VQAAFSQALVEGLGRVPGEPEGLGNGGAPGVTFITNPGPCKNWLLAATWGTAKPNAIVQGSTLNFGTLFLNIMRVAGAGLQYFTYEGHLYKYWYTGYDTKTGKYSQGSQYKNTIYVCTDGMSVLKNPDSSSEYLVVPSSSGGLVQTVHEPEPREARLVKYSPRLLEGEYEEKKEPLMETAFNVRGFGRAPDGDHAFNQTLFRGLGKVITPKPKKITPTPTPKPKPTPTPKLPGHLMHGGSAPSTPAPVAPVVTMPIVLGPTLPLYPPAAPVPAPVIPPPVPSPDGDGTYVAQPIAGQAPVAASTAPITAAIPTVAYVMLGILGVGILGGLAYIISE